MAKKRDKISLKELNRLLNEDKSTSECALHFNVTPAAILYRKKQLEKHLAKGSAMVRTAQRSIKQKMVTVEQLQNINDKANEILEQAMLDISDPDTKGGGGPEIALKAMAEIRNQLRLQVDIYQTMYDLRAVEEFQREVLNAIAEVDKDVRIAIIDNLKKRRTLRSIISAP